MEHVSNDGRVSVPMSLFHAMAACYWGGGPRFNEQMRETEDDEFDEYVRAHTRGHQMDLFPENPDEDEVPVGPITPTTPPRVKGPTLIPRGYAAMKREAASAGNSG